MKQHLNIQKFWGETENTVSDQHLVPVWEVTEPLKEVKCFCLGARHREVPAVHEDIRLREVPQAAVDTVGVGQMQDFQFHGAKLINPDVESSSRMPRSFPVPCQDIQGISH